MSYGRRDVMKRVAAVVDRRLTNCEVELGNTKGWASQVMSSTAPPLLFDDEFNLQYHGIFSDYHLDTINSEGHQSSVSLPAIVTQDKTQFDLRTLHNARIAIRMIENPELPRMIYRVRKTEPDGRHRVLHFLHALGPECLDDSRPAAFPYTFPIVLGGASYTKCFPVDLRLPS